jgi:hypothetical protein
VSGHELAARPAELAIGSSRHRRRRYLRLVDAPCEELL